jgi:hypothetical protein
MEISLLPIGMDLTFTGERVDVGDWVFKHIDKANRKRDGLELAKTKARLAFVFLFNHPTWSAEHGMATRHP